MKKILLALFCLIPSLCFAQYGGGPFPSVSGSGSGSSYSSITQDGNGNIGISSTSPRGKLDVNGVIYGDGSGLTNLPAGAGTVTAVTASFPMASTGGTTPNLSIDLSPYAHTTDLSAYAPLANPHFTGNVGVGSTSPRGELDVNGVIYGTSFYGNGATLTGVDAAGGDITGTLTANKLVKATGASTLSTDTGIYHVGTNIGIGTATPSQFVEFVYPQGGTKFVVISRGGNVGINSASPLAKLDVGGAIYIHGATGNLGIGTYSPRVALQIGQATTSPLGVPQMPNSAQIAGNLEVDGFVYGNGSRLLGIGSGVSGLTPKYVVRALTSSTMEDSAIYNDGANVGIGSAFPRGTLDVNGTIYGSNVFGTMFFGDGSKLINLPAAGGVSGLNANRVPKASSATVIVDSIIYADATNVGISTTTPVAKLHVGVGANTITGSMAAAYSALIKGNLEVDGKIYGDGSGMTNIYSAITYPDLSTTKVGYQAGNDDTTSATKGTFIGYQAGNKASNVGGAVDNTAVGYQSLFTATGGSSNAAVGEYSMNLGNGNNNSVLGVYAGSRLDSANNVAVGVYALSGFSGIQVTGGYNTAVGDYAIQYLRSGSHEIGIGHGALQYDLTGTYNIAVGDTALTGLTSGTQNIAVGTNAGTTVVPGGNNDPTYSIFIGGNTRGLTITDTNTIVLGYGTDGYGSNTVAYGNVGITKHIFQAGNVGIGREPPKNRKLEVIGDLPASSGAAIYFGSSSTAITTGKVLASINFGGVDSGTAGSLDGVGAKIVSTARGTWSTASNLQADLALYNFSGASTISVPKILLASTGNVGINSDAPLQKVDIEGTVYFGGGNVGIGSVSPQQKLDINGAVYLGTGTGGSALCLCKTTGNLLGMCDACATCTTCTPF